jgi:hypothetical protein
MINAVMNTDVFSFYAYFVSWGEHISCIACNVLAFSFGVIKAIPNFHSNFNPKPTF